MGGSSGWVEVVVLAAIAAFVAWRLFSVLGTRTGHEPPPLERRSRDDSPDSPADAVTDIFTRRPRSNGDATADVTGDAVASAPDALRAKLAQVQAADRSFDLKAFTGGARAAYEIILDAYFRNDTATLRPLLEDEAYAGFEAAIAARKSAGEPAARLGVLHDAQVVDASVVAASIQLVVRFTATTHLGEGATATQATAEDLWTFSRHARSTDPTWLLIATDDSIGA